tara:strand:- start:10 stop:222 length:213 start_codon:yes stop_codon:yes gene_type:complete
MNEYCLNAGSNLELAFFMSFFVLLGHLMIHYWLPRRPYIPKEYRNTNSDEAHKSVSLFKQILEERKGEKK